MDPDPLIQKKLKKNKKRALADDEGVSKTKRKKLKTKDQKDTSVKHDKSKKKKTKKKTDKTKKKKVKTDKAKKKTKKVKKKGKSKTSPPGIEVQEKVSAPENDQADEKKEAKTEEEGWAGLKKAQKPDPRIGQTRLFLGNLSFKIDEKLLRATFEPCGEILKIHWVTDKASGKFYGTAFVEFVASDAALAATKLNGKKVMGRPMKVNWATGGGRGGASNRKGPSDIKHAPISEKPKGCTTCFLGNLPYDVDEDTVRAFFKDCGVVTDVRWVMRDEEFKGAGFVEFEVTDATDLAVKLNGEMLGNRCARVDYAPHRPGRG